MFNYLKGNIPSQMYTKFNQRSKYGSFVEKWVIFGKMGFFLKKSHIFCIDQPPYDPNDANSFGVRKKNLKTSWQVCTSISTVYFTILANSYGVWILGYMWIICVCLKTGIRIYFMKL